MKRRFHIATPGGDWSACPGYRRIGEVEKALAADHCHPAPGTPVIGRFGGPHALPLIVEVFRCKGRTWARNASDPDSAWSRRCRNAATALSALTKEINR